MKCSLLAGAALLAAGATVPDVSVFSVFDPVFGRDLFVVAELDGPDAAALWEVKDPTCEEVATASGEVLTPTAFPLQYAPAGAAHPLKSGFVEVEEGRSLLVFKFRPPAGAVASIPRFAGTYRALRGGEEAWVDVPFEELEEGVVWEDESLAAAGFELTRSVRPITVVQVRVEGEVFDVSRVEVRVPGVAEPLGEGDSKGDLGWIEHAFDVVGEAPASVSVTVALESGEAIVLEDVRLGDRYRAVESRALNEAKLGVEVRRGEVSEVWAEGEGTFDLYRRFRWTDRRGKELDLWPSSRTSGGGEHFEARCRIPGALPRGARLQLGVLVGAAWEDVAFAYEDVPGPGEKRR